MTHPAIVLIAAHVTRVDDDVQAAICRACSKPLAALADVHGVVPHVGLRVELGPGFVNAKRRHESGLAHYVRGRHPEWHSPKVRLPLIVTCGCSAENYLAGPDESQRAFSTAPRAELVDEVERVEQVREALRRVFGDAE